MAQYSVEAIVLSARNWGEADKIVTFLSRNLGKITAVAYGCRRPRSPLAGGMQVFSHLQLQVVEGTQLDTIKQCETKTSFKGLRENLETMSYAVFLTELAAEICPERHPEPQVYSLLLHALALLAKRNPRLVALAAAYQLLEYTGSQPEYCYCVTCGREIAEDAFFSVTQGGAVCRDCNAGESVEFAVLTREFIGNLIRLDWTNPASFCIHGAVLVKTEKLLLDYLLFLLEKPLKSLEFIRQLSMLPKDGGS